MKRNKTTIAMVMRSPLLTPLHRELYYALTLHDCATAAEIWSHVKSKSQKFALVPQTSVTPRLAELDDRGYGVIMELPTKRVCDVTGKRCKQWAVDYTRIMPDKKKSRRRNYRQLYLGARAEARSLGRQLGELRKEHRLLDEKAAMLAAMNKKQRQALLVAKQPPEPQAVLRDGERTGLKNF